MGHPPSNRNDRYVGMTNDQFGGMTSIGKTIRDAWVFELIPETETCEGWSLGQIDALVHQVNNEWDKYGCLVSRLPPEMLQRHQSIHQKAIDVARSHGWNGEYEIFSD